ncbi:hypothetical protein [Bythopirellula goksoeyrii]|uniref:Dockerin domain-containing protein n=1 Tax=Bythopirellula goksoeyrii TaxID=1400387 RepID=A0A5B9QAN4_9BACT|nr:hypothetical protein [Bythopirellula goksoeyrii]QEG34705.1 hypothetical protein Pr1d_19870 [Bythopirellula goksoeyrii]
MKHSHYLLIFLLSYSLGDVAANAQYTSYHIGNSLTYDSLGNVKKTTNNSGFQEIAAFYGQTQAIGFHVDGGQPLHAIWNNPLGVPGSSDDDLDETREPYNGYSNALPNYSWDAVVLEPYFSQGATLGSDKQMLANFAGITSSSPWFYIMQVWPQTTWGDYQTYWDGPSLDSDSTPTQPRREFYQNLMGDLDNRYRMIPTGEVIYEIAKALATDAYPELAGLSIYNPADDDLSFHRDTIHLSADLGRYVATATMYSTMHKQDIRGLVPPSNIFDPLVLTPSIADRLNSIIWDVVSSSPYSGIADFNDDGYVNATDLTLWQNEFGTTYDGSDFLNWQRQLLGGSNLLASAVPVPEPTSLALFVVFVVSQARICRFRYNNYQTISRTSKPR